MTSSNSRQPPDPLFILRGSRSAITCLHYQNTGSGRLFSGCQEGEVYIWDLKTRRIKEMFDAHTKSSVLWIKSFECNKLITQGRDGFIKIWHNKNSKWNILEMYKCSSLVFCSSILFAHEGINYIAIPSNTASKVDIISVDSSQVVISLQPMESKQGMCMCLKYAGTSNNKQLLLIGYESGELQLWNIFSKTLMDQLSIFPESIMCMDFSEKYLKGMCGSVGNKLVTFKVADDKLIMDKTVEVVNEGFNNITIRGDDKLIVTCGWDKSIRLFSLKSLKPLAVLKYHKESVQCCTFTSDNILICGSKDKLISLWEIYS
ncbi:guanine nucleotide-binding protein subunit beta-like protein 1 isoform X2 [Patella vulgata]|nr:guanine nucleotide-binding protein subunit beta-like protein 1 isoform X2 [Patella vulgata]XP_050390594.1 guanine nucleotide-binding protein subunit beta-like protein 1 isoform X2 [Patella vulgata]